ncbi:MarR family winged helix-turn-helix transcriptional regulator [Paenibacillus daejeonensis]|uniref:MarR family winged helix-turn-helix transcriptional regulator n=1 Tax=Paenibacillus daejeonensis TaxID=135193 RepID=UPI00035DD21C|nr:MarR family transcriptional regulator [Paenibacillus daejeonensis]
MKLDQCINFLLSSAQNVVFQYFIQKLSPYNVTPAQYGVLNCLWNHGDLTPKQIGELLVLEASSTSGILDRMQKNDLINRSIHPENRRTILVTTTKKADNMRIPFENIVQEMNQHFMNNLTDEEKDLLSKSLMRIIQMNKRENSLD